MSEYMLSRKEAAKRYCISVRGLEELYKRDKTFPVVKFGRRILIPVEAADKWFADYIGGNTNGVAI